MDQKKEFLILYSTGKYPVSYLAEMFEISRTIPVGRAIDDILLMAECSFDDEWEGQVRYLPLC